jgi:hypothetical protein
MKKNHKFRASFTVLNLWDSGNWEEAVKAYFKLPDRFVNKAMADGKAFHEAFEAHINKTKTLPAMFGSAGLRNPKTELKLEVDIYEDMELVGVIDCMTDKEIFEFKTGKTESNNSIYERQVKVYGALAWAKGCRVERANILHYDQYNKNTDISSVWLTEEAIEEALNWVITVGGDIHNYFLKNKLYEKFSPKKV